MRAIGEGLSDRGQRRTNNEDVVKVDNRLGLFVVCDGMGGHAFGELAAELAGQTIEAHVAANFATLEQVAASHDSRHLDLLKVAKTAVERACLAVYEAALAEPERSGMGCTTTLLLVAGTQAVMAHVGDTRMYLLRDDAVSQLTADHTMSQELVRRGLLTSDRARTHAYANVLTRVVGTQESVDVDTLVFDVQPGDTFLLCSDGLSEYLEGYAELSSFLTGQSLSTIPASLIHLANTRGGKDNISVIAVRMEASEAELGYGQQARQQLAALRSEQLFADLSLPELLRVAAVSEIRHCQTGEALIEAGQSASVLVVGVTGKLRASTPQGQVDLGPGDSLGLDTLLKPRPWRSALRAVEPSETVVIHGDQLRALARRRPSLGVSLLSRLGELLSISASRTAAV